MVKPLELDLSANPPELQVAAQAFHAAINGQDHPLAAKAYAYVQNKSLSVDAPYHNLYHTQCVTYYVFFAAKASNLTDWETLNLTLAALFHDFNHSAGLKPDHENIEEAVLGWKSFASDNNLSENRIDTVENLIRCTEYPFKCDPQNLCEAILRDADLLQITCPQWVEMIYTGLASELAHTKRPAGQTMQEFKRSFAHGYRDFWLAAPFHSPWGQALREQNEEVILGRLNAFEHKQ